ncbi:MAG TPA: ABC transporter permease [Methylomirabilota bacterium]|nr:ABC transporter permease [Methylomirabilota bacterium]
MSPPRRRWLPALLVGPTLLLLLVAFVAPLGILLVYSFYESRPGGVMIPAFTLAQYRRFLGDPFYLYVLWRTVLLGLWVTAWCIVLGYPLAYVLARTRSRTVRSVLVTLLLVPLMTSVVVRSYGWMILLANNGLINKALLALGLTSAPVQLLFNTTGVVIALVAILLPYMVLTLVPVIQNIAPALEEASQSLGASPTRMFRDVVVPLSLPGVAAGSILVFVLTIAAYATPRLVGGSRLLVMPIFVYDQTMALLNWPFASATSFILLALVLGLMALQGRLVERRSTWEHGA